MAHRKVQHFARLHRNRFREGVQHLQPSAIGVAIGVVFEGNALGQIDMHPLDNPGGHAVFDHIDAEQLQIALVLFAGQIDPQQFNIARQAFPIGHGAVDRQLLRSERAEPRHVKP